jgi:DNA-binding HxlR family transcriptional regulator
MGRTTRTTRSYNHFCMAARTLEQVGDRWTLLVVRDLLIGPRRFTDLMGLLGGITPKTLSQRLRELQDAGIVEVDREPGRREVWYRLTPAGDDLAPVVHALFIWGLRHARRPPAPGEAVHPEHLLKAVRLMLDQTPHPRQPVVWQFSFADDGHYTLALDEDAWSLAPGLHGTPEVSVTTTTDAWTRYLTTPPPDRPASPPDVELTGTARAIDRFRRLLARFPEGADDARKIRV